MQLTLAVLADYATTSDQGKLVIAGVFDTLRVRKLPTRHPMMAVALRMKAAPDEPKVHTVAVRLVDPDGEELVPELKGRVELPRQTPPESSALQFVVHLPGVKFEKLGPHAVDIFVDGRHMQSLPLVVVEAPERSAPESADPGSS